MRVRLHLRRWCLKATRHATRHVGTTRHRILRVAIRRRAIRKGIHRVCHHAIRLRAIRHEVLREAIRKAILRAVIRLKGIHRAIRLRAILREDFHRVLHRVLHRDLHRDLHRVFLRAFLRDCHHAVIRLRAIRLRVLQEAIRREGFLKDFIKDFKALLVSRRVSILRNQVSDLLGVHSRFLFAVGP